MHKYIVIQKDINKKFIDLEIHRSVHINLM